MVRDAHGTSRRLALEMGVATHVDRDRAEPDRPRHLARGTDGEGHSAGHHPNDYARGPNGPLNFLYAGTDIWFENSVHVKAPVYVLRDVHMESTSVIEGAAARRWRSAVTST